MSERYEKFLKQCDRVLDRMVERVGLTVYLAVFSAVVVGLGVVYATLTPYEQGIARDGAALSPCTYGDGIYFSVVTVTSLGYGELHPIGMSRVLACFEVLFGLLWLGILVAKITSRRLSYHVRRLFSSDAQKRLEEFLAKFQTAEQSLRSLPAAIDRAYTGTPVRPRGGEGDQMRALADFQGNVASLHATSAAYADYISYEGQHDDYFVLAPVETIRRLERTIGDALAALAQLIVRLPPDARGEFLRFENTQPISKARESQQRACAEIARLSADDELTELAVRVDETCRNFPQNYYVVPMAATAPSQPDQVGSSEPQEVTEPGE